MPRLNYFQHHRLGLVTADLARELIERDWKLRNLGRWDGTRNTNPYRGTIRAAVEVLRLVKRQTKT